MSRFSLMATWAVVVLSRVASGQGLDQILTNMGNQDEAAARAEAAGQAGGTGPKYRSTTPNETRMFLGYFTASSSSTKLAIFSDDGCDVTINGTAVLSRKMTGQHLPDLGQSFHLVPFTFAAGQNYQIRVDYSNTVYQGDYDMDGVTLFAFDGGGSIPTPTLVAYDAQYTSVAAGGIDNDAHTTTLTARVSPAMAGVVISFSITSGGTGLDCSGTCLTLGDACPTACMSGRVRARLSGSGGDFFAGLSSTAIQVATDSTGCAAVTLRSANGATDTCTTKAKLDSTELLAAVGFIQPQLSSLNHNPNHPRQGTFQVTSNLTFPRGGQQVGVPGHRVANYVRGVEFDCTLCLCSSWDLGDGFILSCGFFTRCGMYNDIQRYAHVTSGSDTTSGSGGLVQFSVTTYDPDGSDNLTRIHFESRGITSLSNCSSE